MPSDLTYVSLFSGGGGLDIGLERAGFRALMASDLEKICEETFAQNRPGLPFFQGCVSDLTEDVLGDLLGTEFGSVDLLVGGPPCPPYSKSRFYRKDKPRALSDPVGDTTLKGYLDVLETLRPRAFILENVAGFAYKVHAEGFNYLRKRAEGLGYRLNLAPKTVVNSADYGVPQMRRRVIIVGTLEDGFAFPAPTHAQEPSGDLKPWEAVGPYLNDLDDPTFDKDMPGHKAGGQHQGLLELVPPGENYLHFTQKRIDEDPSRKGEKPKFGWRKRYWSFLLKLSPDLPSWTIQARRSNNMGPFHWRSRILRVEEVKRIQTFPDEWDLAGTTEQQWRQVGNAVPPKLAEVVGRAVAQHLESVPDSRGGWRRSKRGTMPRSRGRAAKEPRQTKLFA